MKLLKREPKTTSLFPFFSDDMESMFEGFFRPVNKFWEGERKVPSVDISEKKDRYVLTADLPGFDEDEIKAEVNNGILRISAEHSDEKADEKDGETVVRERHYGAYVRSFSVGDSIIASDISAKFKNGVLTLDMPKSPSVQEKSHTIKIQSS